MADFVDDTGAPLLNTLWSATSRPCRQGVEVPGVDVAHVGGVASASRAFSIAAVVLATLAVGLVMWKASPGAAAGDAAVDRHPARLRKLLGLEHERTRALAHHEAVAAGVERPRDPGLDSAPSDLKAAIVRPSSVASVLPEHHVGLAAAIMRAASPWRGTRSRTRRRPSPARARSGAWRSRPRGVGHHHRRRTAARRRGRPSRQAGTRSSVSSPPMAEPMSTPNRSGSTPSGALLGHRLAAATPSWAKRSARRASFGVIATSGSKSAHGRARPRSERRRRARRGTRAPSPIGSPPSAGDDDVASDHQADTPPARPRSTGGARRRRPTRRLELLVDDLMP